MVWSEFLRGFCVELVSVGIRFIISVVRDVWVKGVIGLKVGRVVFIFCLVLLI